MKSKESLNAFLPEKTHESLGEEFFVRVQPAHFPTLRLRFRNDEQAKTIGLAELSDEEWVQHFARFSPLKGSLEQPLCLKYHGHQFQGYNPELGDGRGFLYAQCREIGSHRLLDLGTKGSGQTPYSRRGDGRLTLKGGVRELLATEMLEALGVHTSKTFSLVETGESLVRYDEPSPTRACVLVRLNHSHIRFGTFQRLAFEENKESLVQLVDYCLEHYYANCPTTAGIESEVGNFFAEVCRKTAHLVGQWMAAGFVHGVLNTDNMNITGESFDYGPFRFAPTFQVGFTAAYFDQQGLYAYGRQPEAVFWNLQQLAISLLSVADKNELIRGLEEYEPALMASVDFHFLKRLGVQSNPPHDSKTVASLLAFLDKSQVSLDAFFFDWYGGLCSKKRALDSPRHRIYSGIEMDSLLSALEKHEAENSERLQQAYFEKSQPESMLIDEIETIWDSIATADDWSLLEQKILSVRKFKQLFRDS